MTQIDKPELGKSATLRSGRTSVSLLSIGRRETMSASASSGANRRTEILTMLKTNRAPISTPSTPVTGVQKPSLLQGRSKFGSAPEQPRASISRTNQMTRSMLSLSTVSQGQPPRLSLHTSGASRPRPTLSIGRMARPETVTLTHGDITPLEHPTASLKEALRGLQSDTWTDQHDSLTLLRRAATHHLDDLLAFPELVPMFKRVLDSVLSLRSRIAKLGLETVTDIYRAVRDRSVPPSPFTRDRTVLGPTLHATLQRATQTNAFLKAQARDAVQAIAGAARPDLVVACLLPAVKNRNGEYRARAVDALEVALGRIPALRTSAQLPDILNAILAFVTDQSGETRRRGRVALLTVYRNIGSDSFHGVVRAHLDGPGVEAMVRAVHLAVQDDGEGRLGTVTIG